MRKRAVGINVRVTAAEKRRMQAAARKCSLTLSEYLRQRALGYDPQPHPPKAVFAALETLDALADLLDPQSKADCRTIADAIRDALLSGAQE